MVATPPLSDIVWADVLGHVRAHHPAIARGWFSQLRPLESGELTIFAPTAPQLTYLSRHCIRPFVEAAQAATSRLVSVRFSVRQGEDHDHTHASSPLPLGPPLLHHEDPPLQLNADYVFDNFIIGPCNRLAHASCSAVSESPGTVYNPLFIHGNVGLGKTHLLQAVCHKVLDHSPAARILYLTCESFVNQFIEAVEQGALDDFRYRYRHLDILLIDDIQFLAGRDRTQEVFFHTFNTLYQLQKEIILTADCPPSEIPRLEERLVSRFNWGLVARIDAPCLETRLAIVRKKARMRDLQLPDDVALFIATRVKANTRELEGALNRVQGLAALDHRSIDMALANQALGEGEQSQTYNVRIQDIMGLVTERFGVKLSDLQGRRRSRAITLPRQVGMYLARRLTPHSLGEIGGFFGGRDHTTVLHANKLIASRRETDPSFHFQLAELEAVLRRAQPAATRQT
jgi:chromosomal replication initiator protein